MGGETVKLSRKRYVALMALAVAGMVFFWVPIEVHN